MSDYHLIRFRFTPSTEGDGSWWSSRNFLACARMNFSYWSLRRLHYAWTGATYHSFAHLLPFVVNNSLFGWGQVMINASLRDEAVPVVSILK